MALTISPNHEGALKATPSPKALAGVVPVDALLATIDRLTSHSLTRSGRETLNAHRLEILDATGQEERVVTNDYNSGGPASEKSRASIAKALERRKQRLTMSA